MIPLAIGALTLLVVSTTSASKGGNINFENNYLKKIIINEIYLLRFLSKLLRILSKTSFS